MSTIYECDWCGSRYGDRAAVASADITIGTRNEKLHMCQGCAPEWLRDEYPEDVKPLSEPDLVADGGQPQWDLETDEFRARLTTVEVKPHPELENQHGALCFVSVDVEVDNQTTDWLQVPVRLDAGTSSPKTDRVRVAPTQRDTHNTYLVLNTGEPADADVTISIDETTVGTASVPDRWRRADAREPNPPALETRVERLERRVAELGERVSAIARRQGQQEPQTDGGPDYEVVD